MDGPEVVGAKEKLRQFAAELRDLSTSEPPITPELVEFVATAFERYMSEVAEFEAASEDRPAGTRSWPTLDEAFGIAPPRGRPVVRSEDELLEIALDVLWSRDWAKESGQRQVNWKILEDRWGASARHLREIRDEFRTKAMAKRISQSFYKSWPRSPNGKKRG